MQSHRRIEYNPDGYKGHNTTPTEKKKERKSRSYILKTLLLKQPPKNTRQN